ncbi:hypothetical protein ACN3XK_50985 [Actinomadura welshii]|uniref:DUF3558 domain-containing protein n=2 Tax=Actinomadura livida TaxID=79909 RepID=A0A7W7N138_9ACTN|nr:hypothetical protein [Actinomadura catellatispora]MBB4777545.1 hypothetical protein [Actinomadura catellatispora]
MGLQRPPEPFHRVYSAPEPPSPPRGPRLLKLLAVLAAFAVAGAGVFLVVPGRSQSGGGGSDAAAVAQMPAGAEHSPVRPREFVRSLPAPCGTVSRATVDRTVPKARPRQSGNSTLTTCTYSAEGSPSRWLRVEAHLYAPDDTATPVEDAANLYDERWEQAHDAPPVRTISLRSHQGLGDEAYRWFKADEAGPAVIGQVTARTRNAVLTVSYGEHAPGAAERRDLERACLDRATAVAREAVAALNHF